MPDITQDFLIAAPAAHVFRGIATPEGLDTWWTKQSQGQPKPGAEYQLGFGPGYEWRATVSRFVPDREFELELTSADAEDDWLGTRVGFVLDEKNGTTTAHFHHTGWPQSNDHYRFSCYCWAMYLRLLKRYVEHGEVVPYEKRLDV